MVNYDIQRDSWYSPIKVLDEFEKLREYFGETVILKEKVFERAVEMFTGAVTLLGAYELSSENKYLQQANNQTDSPDVMGIKQVLYEGKIHALITQMEAVELNEKANTDDIVDFLKQTKLSPKKAYTEDDMIVLTINRQIPYNAAQVHTKLFELNPKPTIYIIARIVGANVGDFMISTPWPKLCKSVKFNVNETAEKYSIPERAKFGLGLETEIKYTKTDGLAPVSTYDILGLDRKKIFKKLKVKD